MFLHPVYVSKNLQRKCSSILLLSRTQCQPLPPVLRKSIMSQVAVKENGKDVEGGREGTHYSTEERESLFAPPRVARCPAVVPDKLPQSCDGIGDIWEPWSPLKRGRWSGRGGGWNGIKGLSRKILPLWWYRWLSSARPTYSFHDLWRAGFWYSLSVRGVSVDLCRVDE